MKRKHNINHIKQNYSYTVNELCEKLGVHKNTVLRWINKEDLKTLGKKKPFLVHGLDLREFLKNRQQSQKNKCKDDEFFCVKCQVPQKPWENMVDIMVMTKNRANMKGLCEKCDRDIYKGLSVKKIEFAKNLFDVGLVHNLHLLEQGNNACNGDFN